MKKIVGAIALAVVLVGFLGWLMGSSNPKTPAGYVGYLTQGALFGKAKYYGLQTGPSSSGRTWLLSVTNVSKTPYTYTETFSGDESVLSSDNMKISFNIHLVWQVRPGDVKQFVENYSVLIDGKAAGKEDKDPDSVVKIAYDNFLKEPLRTYARDQIQRLKGLEVKDQITPIGDAIFARVKDHVKGTPFEVTGVVVGNIQYPTEVADAVAKKMATTQLLEQKQTEIKIEEAEKAKRIVQAEGIAKAMEIIQVKLTSQYLQHEAIEAQKAMVGSPNHSVIYIPVGNNGVPLVTTTNEVKK